MKAIFKTTTNDDGDSILWFSDRGRLIKAAVYTKDQADAITEDELQEWQERDAQIFLRGWGQKL